MYKLSRAYIAVLSKAFDQHIPILSTKCITLAVAYQEMFSSSLEASLIVDEIKRNLRIN